MLFPECCKHHGKLRITSKMPLLHPAKLEVFAPECCEPHAKLRRVASGMLQAPCKTRCIICKMRWIPCGMANNSTQPQNSRFSQNIGITLHIFAFGDYIGKLSKGCRSCWCPYDWQVVNLTQLSQRSVPVPRIFYSLAACCMRCRGRLLPAVKLWMVVLTGSNL